MNSPAPIGAATSSAAAQPSSISVLYAAPGAPLAMELQNTIQAGGTARNIGQRNKRNPIMKAALVKRVDTTARTGNSITGISEYSDEEAGMSLIPRRIRLDLPHRQPRRQNRPAARLPAASGIPAWLIKPRAKPSKALSRFSGDGESIRRRIKSRREIVAGERSAETRVEPGSYGAWRCRARGREQVG